jgi:hypothetical protein
VRDRVADGLGERDEHGDAQRADLALGERNRERDC